jgi:hypothetical protein
VHVLKGKVHSSGFILKEYVESVQTPFLAGRLQEGKAHNVFVLFDFITLKGQSACKLNVQRK